MLKPFRELKKTLQQKQAKLLIEPCLLKAKEIPLEFQDNQKNTYHSKIISVTPYYPNN